MQESVNRAAGLDFLVFVGARPESFASGNGAKEVLLLQPDPKVAASLERVTKGQAGVRVIASSIGKASEQVTLNVMNMGALSSLRQPTPALLSLFPGLRTVATRDVHILPVADLDIPVATDDMPYWLRLRIDMPGSELDILSCLDENGLLARAAECIVLCAADVFFEGACDYQTVVDFLAEKGFLQTDRDDSDPDWPVLRFRGNPQLRQATLARIASLEAGIAAAQAEAETARKTVADRDAALVALKSEHEAKSARLSEIEAALVEAQAKTELAQKTITEQHSAAAKQADIEKSLRATLTEKDTELADLKDKAEKFRIVVGELEAERSKLRQQTTAQTEATKVLEATAEERKKRIGLLETENKRTAELQSDVGFQIRMNALLRNDINDLAGRFEQSEKQRLRLEELLRMLTPKLEQAAKELHLLQVSSQSKAKMVEVAGGKPKTKRGRRERNA